MDGYTQGHVERKKEDVLFCVPKIHYFCTRCREMSIPMALSSEIFIDETLEIP